MRRRDLERALEAVPDFPHPTAALEQYRTPAPVAADLLWEMALDGAIDGKHVMDLGCGTGVLSLGAHLLGASVTGVDVDAEALAIARQQVPEGTFIEEELAAWEPIEADTVVMNPPFGAQKRGADRVFYEKAAACVRDRGGSVWFLAQPKTHRFLSAYARGLGMEVEKVAQWDYPIEARFAFHDKAVARIEVAGYRMA